MKCPKCGLFNPDESLKCDCGYDFSHIFLLKVYDFIIKAYQNKTDMKIPEEELILDQEFILSSVLFTRCVETFIFADRYAHFYLGHTGKALEKKIKFDNLPDGIGFSSYKFTKEQVFEADKFAINWYNKNYKSIALLEKITDHQILKMPFYYFLLIALLEKNLINNNFSEYSCAIERFDNAFNHISSELNIDIAVSINEIRDLIYSLPNSNYMNLFTTLNKAIFNE